MQKRMQINGAYAVEYLCCKNHFCHFCQSVSLTFTKKLKDLLKQTDLTGVLQNVYLSTYKFSGIN